MVFLPFTATNSFAKEVFLGDDGYYAFSNETFADCADIAARHVMNLLFYNKQNEWDFVLGNDEKSLEADCKTIVDAIRGNTKVPSRLLKDRLRLFIYYQKNFAEGNADAVDIITRSFWNYVISNMNEDASQNCRRQTLGLVKVK